MLWNRHTVYCRGPFAANEPAGPTDKAVPGKRSCRTLSTGGKLKNRMLRDACLTVGILVFGVAHPACPPGLPILKSPWVCRYYKFLFARKEDKPALREVYSFGARFNRCDAGALAIRLTSSPTAKARPSDNGCRAQRTGKKA